MPQEIVFQHVNKVVQRRYIHYLTVNNYCPSSYNNTIMRTYLHMETLWLYAACTYSTDLVQYQALRAISISLTPKGYTRRVYIHTAAKEGLRLRAESHAHARARRSDVVEPFKYLVIPCNSWVKLL